jgi:hypothetical protein
VQVHVKVQSRSSGAGAEEWVVETRSTICVKMLRCGCRGGAGTGADVQRCMAEGGGAGAEMQRCRGGAEEVQRGGAGAEVQVQRCRWRGPEAEVQVQKFRGAEEVQRC